MSDRRTAKAQQLALGAFARSLQERFAAEGTTEITEAVECSDDVAAALFGVCSCGNVFRRRTAWTLADETITGHTDAVCSGGHSIDMPFDLYGPGWVVVTEMGRVVYEGSQ